MDAQPQIENICDIAQLQRILNDSDNLEFRRKIRSRIRQLRKQLEKDPKNDPDSNCDDNTGRRRSTVIANVDSGEAVSIQVTDQTVPITKMSIEEIAARETEKIETLSSELASKCLPNTKAKITVKSDVWTSKKPTTTERTIQTKEIGQHVSSGSAPPPQQKSKRTVPVRSVTSVKEALIAWSQKCVQDYPVEIRNLSTSWADAMAFCALIHHFYPQAFDFDKLDRAKRKDNFDLAFTTAEKYAGITPLLESDDMILMGDRPDWKCILTYLQCFYRRFHGETKLPNEKQ